jgi:hypothetical protein
MSPRHLSVYRVDVLEVLVRNDHDGTRVFSHHLPFTQAVVFESR